MKTIFNICFIVCYILTNATAQQWLKVNSTFTPSTNYTTWHGTFVDKKNGWWLTGPTGAVLHTTDCGISWFKLSDSIALENIEFTDTLHGWMVGRSNRVNSLLITKDGGKNWERFSTPVVTGLMFFDSLVGFGGGSNNIYKTTDGGITWDTMSIQSHIGKIGVYDIFFLDKKHGWAVGGGGALTDMGFILNTVDSGKTWQYIDSMTNINQAITFTDSLHGYAVGSNPPYGGGVIKVTNNGGITWVTHDLPGSWLLDVVFTSDSSGWAVGQYGYIWHTTDQGIHWTQSESGTTSDLYRIFFFNNGEVGYILGADSTLLKYEKTVDLNEDESVVVSNYKVYQNYPNPFNSSTQIRYDIPENGLISLTIYDLLGKEVKTLIKEEKKSGSYTVNWNGKDNNDGVVSTGIYFYQLRTALFQSTHKLIVLK